MFGLSWEWWLVLIVGLVGMVYAVAYVPYLNRPPSEEDDYWSEADIEQRIREGKCP